MSDEEHLGKPIVLVVDDSPEYLTLVGGMLQAAYTVRVASTGRRALELAVQEPRPDVVVLDVLMPDMDGHAVLAALRADPRTSDIPAIFMTSLQSDRDESAGLSEGAADYIIKPAVPAVVQARVRSQVELKRMRDRLRRHNDELQAEIEQRERLEKSLRQTVADLEAFSYSVSHDLRAPLAAIGGFALALQETEATALSTRALAHLGRIVAGAHKMDRMIDDILSYSRTSQLQMRPRPVCLDSIVAEVVEDARQPYPAARITVDALPQLRADAAMLRQILHNLVGNALKFSSKRADAVVEIGAVPLEGATEVFVRDNGSGFDAAYAGKLFGLFQRLHREQEFAGTGVGLAIVKRLVLRHGGQVRAESVPGGWTTFAFTLPA